MRLFAFEHSRASYIADYMIYGCAVTLLSGLLVVGQPPIRLIEDLGLTVSGLAIWTFAEYGLHRYVLHGIQPFMTWHIEHHSRPKALIGSPTILSAALITCLVFLPAWLASNVREASAITLGVLIGYLIYSITHHAVHHWRAENSWLKRRRRIHTLHHHSKRLPGRYGVTTEFWDRIFGTDGLSCDNGENPLPTKSTRY